MRKILFISLFVLSVNAIAEEESINKEKESKLEAPVVNQDQEEESQKSEKYKYHLEYIKRIDRSAAGR